jgi:hypothetical protein
MMDVCVSIIAAERGELKKIYCGECSWMNGVRRLTYFAVFEELVEQVGQVAGAGADGLL